MRGVFCYAPQLRDVCRLLDPLLRSSHDVSTVDERDLDRLRGCEDATFVMVVGHASDIPPILAELLMAQGCVVWSLDDSLMRSKERRS